MAGKQADIKVGVITNYDDKGLKGAKNSLTNFKTAIADADGVGGKLKAGWGSVTDSVKANAGALAVAAGASLVAFGVKAVGAFTDTAKAALDLGSATGLAVEDASRWIAVGDDFEVGADQLTAGIGKIAKSLDEPKWGKYGIATRDAAGEARDANDVLLDSLTMLSDVTNETDQARIGNALFGKGYANLAPLIGHTKDEYESMLGSVEKGQVVTKQEAEKAEKFRLAEDQLGDALHEVTLQVGQQVAGMAPLIIALAKFIGLTTEAFGPGGLGGNSFREATDAMRDMRTEIEAAGLDFGDLEQKVIAEGLSVEELTKIVDEATAAHEKLHGTLREGEKSWETQTEWLEKQAIAAGETDRETRRLTEGMKGGNEAFEGAKRPIDNASRALEAFRTTVAGVDLAYRELTGKLDEEEAWENVNAKIVEFNTAEEKSPELIRNTIREIAAYVTETDTIPESKKTEILASLKDGDLEKAEAQLAEFAAKYREIRLAVIAGGSGTAAGYNPGTGPAFAEGGVVPGLKGAPVAATVHGGETVRTPEQEKALNGNGGGGSTTVNIYPQFMPTPKQLANILAQYDRHNATNIVTPVGR